MKKIFLFFACCYSTLCSSQTGNFKVYSLNEGLPQSQVLSVLQDNGGYMWFGTGGGGLARFDGKSFLNYATEDGLADNHIYTLFEDKENQLWIGTQNGISILKGKQFLSLPEPLKKFSNTNVRVITKAVGNKLWIGSDKGAFLWDGKNIIEISQLSGIIIQSIFTDSKNNTWFGTAGSGVAKLSKLEMKFYSVSNGLANNSVWSISEDLQHTIWLGTENGITKYKDDKFYSFNPDNNLNTHILKLFCDRQGNIGIGTAARGVFKYDGSELVGFNSKKGLSTDGINDIYQDREGNIWLGSDGGGVFKVTSSAFYSTTEKQGLLSNLVLSIYEDSKGNLWFGTFKGVSKFDGKTFTNYDKSNGLSSEKIWSIIEDADKNIWIGGYINGLFKYNGKSFLNFNESNGLSNNNVRTIFKDGENNLWVGTLGGLNRFNGKNFDIYTTKNGLPSDRVLTMFQDSRKEIWIGTAGGGLCKMTRKSKDEPYQFITCNISNGLIDNTISSITEDKNGYLWVSTFKGLSRINLNNPQKGIKNFTKADGFKSNTMYIAVVDSKGDLLVGTNYGIDKVNLTEFYKTGKFNIRNYGKEEGYFGFECNTNACAKDKAGNIWFGTIQGAVLYYAERETPNIIEPSTHINNVRLFFQPAEWKKYTDSVNVFTGLPYHSAILPYDQNHLTFDFIGISTSIPEKVNYQFKLKGFDNDWSPKTKDVFATYSNLPPGNYTFMVKAGNNDDVWNIEPAKFSFRIMPPFWRTWWFYVLSLMTLTLLIYGFVANRVHRLKMAKLILEKQVLIKTNQLVLEKETVEKQKKEIERKNDNITASIKYAQRIQQAVLPDKEIIYKLLPKSFILFKPRDIVSGDFYWFAEKNNKIFVSAIDCTGHGVPGAFMSLIGNELLTEIVLRNNQTDPGKILQLLHESLIIKLKKEAKESFTVDGMDISLVAIDKNSDLIEFASTGKPLIHVHGDQLKAIRNSNHPLGLIHKKENHYETHKIKVEKEDTIYILTDGYCDQFGGDDGEKFMYPRFHELLLSLRNTDISEQEALLDKAIENWKGENVQLDDILVIGMKM
jgi:ligand-binding sensor domain-containing protein/serine phosphatase RsbU (regulator of sigma subunit)